MDKAKRKKAAYDALVPLSGGKDSSYLLYLARSVYNLKVLTYTFDNGFLAPAARKNIQGLTESLGVDHITFQPSWDFMKRLYRGTLLLAGDMCGACAVGINGTIYQIAAAYRIPLILSGVTLMEADSGSPESIADTARLRVIVRDYGQITEDEIGPFLASGPPRTLFHYAMATLGLRPHTVYPLLYGERTTEKEIRDVLVSKTGWRDVPDSPHSKHFDCVAEPFTNYIREHRHGYSRRACQYSTLIRVGEMAREEAQKALEQESPRQEPSNTGTILERLELSRDDLARILKIELTYTISTASATLGLCVSPGRCGALTRSGSSVNSCVNCLEHSAIPLCQATLGSCHEQEGNGTVANREADPRCRQRVETRWIR